MGLVFGGLYAARLKASGHDVTVLARGKRLMRSMGKVRARFALFHDLQLDWAIGVDITVATYPNRPHHGNH